MGAQDSKEEYLSKSIYDFKFLDLDGNEVSLEKYRGKVLLIVNVASKCGLTDKNYKQLQAMYERLHQKGLVIVGFPCNQFGKQEPGCTVDIKEFLRKKKITFPVFEKVDVNGESALPLYQYLKHVAGGFITDSIKWNFTKFLVDKYGKVVARYSPVTSPESLEEVVSNLLEE